MVDTNLIVLVEDLTRLVGYLEWPGILAVVGYSLYRIVDRVFDEESTRPTEEPEK